MVEFSEELREKGLKALEEFIDEQIDSHEIKQMIDGATYNPKWLDDSHLLDERMTIKYDEIKTLKNFVFSANSITNSMRGNRTDKQPTDIYQKMVKILELDLWGLYAKALKETSEIANVTDIVTRVY